MYLRLSAVIATGTHQMLSALLQTGIGMLNSQQALKEGKAWLVHAYVDPDVDNLSGQWMARMLTLGVAS